MFEEFLNDKRKKTKEKTEMLGQMLLSNPKILGELIEFSSSAKDPQLKQHVLKPWNLLLKVNLKLFLYPVWILCTKH